MWNDKGKEHTASYIPIKQNLTPFLNFVKLIGIPKTLSSFLLFCLLVRLTLLLTWNIFGVLSLVTMYTMEKKNPLKPSHKIRQIFTLC